MFNGQLAYKNPVKRYEELRIRIESFIDDESNGNFNDLILETHSFQRSTCQLIHNYAAHIIYSYKHINACEAVIHLLFCIQRCLQIRQTYISV